jgi:membrane protease YdiL (CAAX protease family)
VDLPGDRGFDTGVQREQDRGRNRAAEAILRLQTDQSQDLVRTHHSPHAWRDTLDVWPDALDEVPAPGPAISGSGGTGDVPMFLAFFVAALGEELGSTGYVLDPMLDRWNALEASILLGLVWAVWYLMPLRQAHRSLAWIAWWSLYTVALRVLMTWIYNHTGKSVFAAALFHDMSNLSWQLFPNYGSHWNPRITGLIIAFAAVIVTVLWGPRTLARFRNA